MLWQREQGVSRGLEVKPTLILWERSLEQFNVAYLSYLIVSRSLGDGGGGELIAGRALRNWRLLSVPLVKIGLGVDPGGTAGVGDRRG